MVKMCKSFNLFTDMLIRSWNHYLTSIPVDIIIFKSKPSTTDIFPSEFSLGRTIRANVSNKLHQEISSKPIFLLRTLGRIVRQNYLTPRVRLRNSYSSYNHIKLQALLGSPFHETIRQLILFPITAAKLLRQSRLNKIGLFTLFGIFGC